MFAETLEMKRIKTEKKKHEYYRTILQESERLTRLVNNLLNFSRMEAGKRNYQMHDVDLNGVVEKVVEFYALQLRAQHFDLVIDLAEKSPVVIGDEEAIAEALHNIIDNAVKYSDGESTSELRPAPLLPRRSSISRITASALLPSITQRSLKSFIAFPAD